MLIDNHFTSLELSIKLYELGVKQQSLFYWEYWDAQAYAIKFIPHCVTPRNSSHFRHYSAFTASELIELLPHRVTIKESAPFNSFTLYIKKSFVAKNWKDLLDKDKHPEPVSIEEINYQPIYIVNYECDSTECTGIDAWLKRNLFEHNIYDENFPNALAKTFIYLTENKLRCIHQPPLLGLM